jgi:hypothetical protein
MAVDHIRSTQLGATWLRNKAAALRSDANATGAAYAYEPKLSGMCRRVADAYRRAAVLLDDEAMKMEDET